MLNFLSEQGIFQLLTISNGILFSSLLKVKMKEMVKHVKYIFECHQKLISLAHIFIEWEYTLSRSFLLIYPASCTTSHQQHRKDIYFLKYLFLKIYHEKKEHVLFL